MREFEITSLSESSVLYLVDIRNRIKIDPEYQRPGGVWALKNKQLFIDSLLNRYDIPKLYFHTLVRERDDLPFKWAIIDGRQRLEAIWDFFDGNFALDEDFEDFSSPDTQAAGLKYEELAKCFPKLLSRLHSRILDVRVINTDDLDTIEDMFSRLNEAVPLNAAEKRNAFSGPLPALFRELARHEFFRRKIRVPETRYRHLDIAAKMFYLQHRAEFVDTKRAPLDRFVRGAASREYRNLPETLVRVKETLSAMCRVFEDDDPLLRSSGMVIIYFMALSKLQCGEHAGEFEREDLIQFENRRKQNRQRLERDEEDVDFRLIEFDELIRSSNDGSSIRRRCEVLLDELGFAMEEIR